MKRFIAFLLIFSCLMPFMPISAEETDNTGGAENGETTEGTDSSKNPNEQKPEKPSYDSDIKISEDGAYITAAFMLLPETVGTYYLFRVTPDNEDIANMEPFSQADAENGMVSFKFEFDSKDDTAIFYGYVLANKSEDGYTALTKGQYINNISDISHNDRPFFKSTSIKGLDVQYITDAQLIGVGQTVVRVKLNELISNDSDETKSTAITFGSETYLINNETLSQLDNKIKSFTEAGINVYINYILTFDENADESLYYPKAKGDSDTIFAPNVSNFDSAKIFAAVMHFIAERYSRSDAKYGFCGSYILGYEVNNTLKNHNSGLNGIHFQGRAYASYLRFADIAVRSAYKNAKIYASVSNVWNAAEGDPEGLYGAKSFITKISQFASDVNFGIAINPYPSDPNMTEFWLDEKATENSDTQYLTMKNLSVLQEFLNERNILCGKLIRSVVISEFGVSGVYGEESEKAQAAAYAYAFYNASRLPTLEAFIWRRHVDHNNDIDLNYGLYTSTVDTLERKEKKEIYDVFAAADCFDSDSVNVIKSLCSRLPIINYEELIKDTKSRTRVILTIPDVLAEIGNRHYDTSALFDFSKSTYNFYPTENTNYIEQVNEDGFKFMRIASLRISPFEHMGAGFDFEDHLSMAGAEYLTVHVRINASCADADFVLMIDGNSRNGRATLNFSSTIETDTWVTLKFPIHGLTRKEIANARIKIWARTDTSNDEQIFIDVASVKLHYEKNLAPFILITVIVICGVIGSFVALIYVLTHKKRKSYHWE